MTRSFYDYPKRFETGQYSFERKVNGFHVVYEVKEKGKEVIGFIEIDLEIKIKEHSGFINGQFSSVREGVKQYFRKFRK